MKNNRLIKKITALIMAVITILSICPLNQVFAATGDVGTASLFKTHDSDGNEIKYNSSAIFGDHTAGGSGKNQYRIYVNGAVAFCIQPGAPLNTGNTLTESSSDAWNALSSEQKKAVGLALLYGYQGNKSNLSGNDDEIYNATQVLVWEFVTGCRQSTGSYTQIDTAVYSLLFGSNYANSGTRAAYDQIVSLLQKHNTIPSFMSESQAGVTKEFTYSGGKYSITLTDNNGVLSEYTLSCSDSNISITKSGNSVTICSTAALASTAQITATRNNVPTVSSSATLVAYGSTSVQDIVTGVINADSVVAYINVETPNGELALKKVSEDGIVAGIEFTITGNNFEKTVKTGSDGTILVEDMFPGTYTVTEASYDRYVPQKSQTVTIIGGQTSTVSFSNVLKKFRVTVTKYDSEATTAQGDATLAGAVYGIYNNGELVDTYTTDINGQFTTSYYICGDNWTIKEISPSEGYLLDSTEHHIGADAKLYTVEHNSTSNGVTEQVIKGKIAIIKHTDNGETQIETPEAGAAFEVYLKSTGSYDNAKAAERDILTCDDNGFAQTKDLPYGIYTVHQTSGWDGRELIGDFDVYINSNGEVYRYIINNSYFESYIKIVKKDAETGNTIAYAGAGFQLYDPSGNLITMTFTYPEVTTIDIFYTNSKGYLITPEKLEYGTGYSLIEVQAPYGYVLNSEPIYFDVVQDNSTTEDGITVIEVVRSNMAQKGTITISKSGEVFSSVSENDGLYQPVYSVKGLSGAVYEITAAEDIYTLDGTLRATKGEVVDTITTENGPAASKELYLGKYDVKETTAPYGMVLNSEVKTVDLTYAGQNIEVTETATSFYNERQRVEIDLKKSLEIDDRFGIGANGEMLDVSFGLYAEAEIKAADGTVIPADGLIEVLSLDENGYGKALTDLPFGSYYVKEISANAAYVISDEKYAISFEYGGQDSDLIHITANDGKTIENKLIYGSISGIKLDEDNQELGGALIGIFKIGTEEFTIENAIATTTSADDGSFSFEKVPYGAWVIKEIESPTGFVLSDEEIIVVIGKADEIVEIELVNYFIKGNIELTKVDKDFPDNHLIGALFEVYADTNENGKFDDEDQLYSEMTALKDGVYQLNDLRYGQYFVREKTAPEGFVLDENVYPVFIEEEGKTYVIENEAGIGFINVAQAGSLKIVKTSSDGKKEGFSFRVTGNNYDQTFTTDANGEITIEDLRIGEYTVSEENDSASAGYTLPADVQITVKANETVTVTMHNIMPDTPKTDTPKTDTLKADTPKTGDDSNLALWIGLALICAIGAGTTCFITFKKKKKKKKVQEQED